jgi:hypothetical protein
MNNHRFGARSGNLAQMEERSKGALGSCADQLANINYAALK